MVDPNVMFAYTSTRNALAKPADFLASSTCVVQKGMTGVSVYYPSKYGVDNPNSLFVDTEAFLADDKALWGYLLYYMYPWNGATVLDNETTPVAGTGWPYFSAGTFPSNIPAGKLIFTLYVKFTEEEE